MTKYTAVIIEPRKHKALQFVLNNFFENLSNEWSFVILHGNQNKEYIMDIMDNQLPQYKSRVIQYVNLEVDNLNHIEYSKIVVSKNFHNYIPSEVFLIFQTDSMILKENKLLINDFLEYDYVGAPWAGDNQIGNGGLSLRRKSKMLEIINNIEYHNNENEDYYFCLQNIIHLNKPTFEEAKKFSIETVFNETSFGIHRSWKYLNNQELNYLLERYPDLNTLINLNN